MRGIVGVELAKGCHITAVTVGDELRLRRPTCGKAFPSADERSRSEREHELLIWTGHVWHVAESRRHAGSRVLY
jgi:hypothetical protein